MGGGIYQHRAPDGEPLFVSPGEDEEITAMFGVFLSGQGVGHGPLVLSGCSFPCDIDLRLIKGEVRHFSVADEVAIALDDEVATLADERKIGTAHHHILGEALVQGSGYGFASLVDPCVVNSGEDIANGNLLCRDTWLIGHGD